MSKGEIYYSKDGTKAYRRRAHKGHDIKSASSISGKAIGESIQKATLNRLKESESAAQKTVVQFCRTMENSDPRYRNFTASQNQQKGGLKFSGIFKAEGMRKGWPDMQIATPNIHFHGLFIELKAGKNKPSEEQIQCLGNLIMQGNFACIAYGSEQALFVIRQYFSNSYGEKKAVMMEQRIIPIFNYLGIDVIKFA